MFNHLLFGALLCCGLLLIYRGTLDEDNYQIINAKVIAKEIKIIDQKRNGSERYGLILSLNNSEKEIGVYLGTEKNVPKDSWINKMQLNESYRFFMDPTVASSNGIRLGLRKITKGAVTIFEEKVEGQFYVGLGVSVFIAFFWYFYAQKRR